MSDLHYLEKELNDLFQSDLSMWSFLQEASLDGVWYWDLEKPNNEWMSPKLWETFGVDPKTKKHDPAEWQELIYEEDLTLAMENFEAHLANPDHPYDQIVRYRHADGSTVWVRCRGLAVRDDTGKPVRMLGAHTNLTDAKRSEADALAGWRASELSNRGLQHLATNMDKNVLTPFRDMSATLHNIANASAVQANPDLATQVQNVISQLAQAGPMIDDMKAYADLVGHSDEKEPIQLEPLFREIQETLSEELDACGATLEIGEMSSVVGYRRQLRRLFELLIRYAISARNEHVAPLIVVYETALKVENQVEITVADDGQSFPMRPNLDVVDIMNLRQPNDIKQQKPLGPTMCQRIAFNHATELSARNFGGKRAAFSITLPLSSDNADRS